MIRIRAGLFLLLSFLSLAALAEGADLQLLPADRLLILVPHPDDEVLCCGGLVQKAVQEHVPIKIVFLTYGDNNAWAFTLYHHFPVFRPKKMLAMGELRRREALSAAEILGVSSGSLVFLGYPDYGTLTLWKDHWGQSPPYESRMTRVRAVPYSTAYRPGAAYKGEDVLHDLQSIITGFRPTKLFMPHPADLQADHQALTLFTRTALENLGNEFSPDVYFYLIHCTAWPVHRGLHKDQALDPPPSLQDAGHWLTLALTDDQADQKYTALKKHRTQWAYSGRFMSSYVRRNELFMESPVQGDHRPYPGRERHSETAPP
jgi:LmbE family N-acetylglucosaminyl deacetylase